MTPEEKLDFIIDQLETIQETLVDHAERLDDLEAAGTDSGDGRPK